MKWKLVAAVAGAALLLGAGLFWGGETAHGPEAIHYGRDTCARCRMHISQKGLGGELRDAKGRLTKYDDLGCLLIAMSKAHRAFPGAWAEDYAGGGFVDLTSAHFVLTDGHRTPMGYGVVAFTEEGAAAAYAASTGGRAVRLEEVLKDTARFQQGTLANAEEGAHR